jgi:hypothetical protein
LTGITTACARRERRRNECRSQSSRLQLFHPNRCPVFGGTRLRRSAKRHSFGCGGPYGSITAAPMIWRLSRSRCADTMSSNA